MPAFPRTHHQTLPLQIRSMREYAAKRNWTIAAQIKEVGSGASQRELRETLLAAARRREIDVVLVWRLDRWGRSVTDLVSTLQELQHLGVGFVSPYRGARSDHARRPRHGRTARRVRRVRTRGSYANASSAGLAHARLNGKRLGRPPSVVHKTIETRNLYRQGLSKSEIARRLEIGRTSVRRILSPKKAITYAALPERTRRLDRWGRPVADLVSTLQELQHLGVGFVSLILEALDLTTPTEPRHGRTARRVRRVRPTRRSYAIRVRAGLAHARLNGQTPRAGHPRWFTKPSKPGTYTPAEASVNPRSLDG